MDEAQIHGGVKSHATIHFDSLKECLRKNVS
jgi:hypothetical protein